jgi:hypothetical protein
MDAAAERVSRGAVRALLLFVAGCGLSETQCLELRAAAFDVENRAQPCMDDTDCAAAEWPGCAKAVASAAATEVERFKTRFVEGRCREERTVCAPTPEAFCDRNLCVLRFSR